MLKREKKLVLSRKQNSVSFLNFFYIVWFCLILKKDYTCKPFSRRLLCPLLRVAPVFCLWIEKVTTLCFSIYLIFKTLKNSFESVHFNRFRLKCYFFVFFIPAIFVANKRFTVISTHFNAVITLQSQIFSTGGPYDRQPFDLCSDMRFYVTNEPA